MAVAVRLSSKKIAAFGLGSIIAVGIIIFGMRTVLTRAVDEVPRAVTVSDIKGTSAVINWETGQSVQGAVKYGKGPTDADLTSIAPDLEPTHKHKVELTLLESGATYYFKIIGGTDTDYDNSGSPWTFTTSSDDKTVTTALTPTRSVSAVQRLVIGASAAPSVAPPSVNCLTEKNCELIKANFPNGCSTSDYVRCEFRK